MLLPLPPATEKLTEGGSLAAAAVRRVRVPAAGTRGALAAAAAGVESPAAAAVTAELELVFPGLEQAER